MPMNDEIRDHVEQHAPELDPEEVSEFLERHEKPAQEPGTALEWATELLRRRARGEEQERPSIELVQETMREHDSEWHG
jgi:hypothetical protein